MLLSCACCSETRGKTLKTASPMLLFGNEQETMTRSSCHWVVFCLLSSLACFATRYDDRCSAHALHGHTTGTMYGDTFHWPRYENGVRSGATTTIAVSCCTFRQVSFKPVRRGRIHPFPQCICFPGAQRSHRKRGAIIRVFGQQASKLKPHLPQQISRLICVETSKPCPCVNIYQELVFRSREESPKSSLFGETARTTPWAIFRVK